MKVNNTLDELLFAAMHGLEPDDEDLQQVRVPAGEDSSRFLSDLRATARQIVALRGEGSHGEARQVADRCAAEYLEKFQALMPIPAGAAQAQRVDNDNDDASLTDIGRRMFGR